MNTTQINQKIDRITHGTFLHTTKAIIDELFDQGFEPWEIRDYLIEKFEESEGYITEKTYEPK